MDHNRPADAVSPVVDLTVYDAVIFDFDGPMCNVFASYSAAAISRELKQLLVADGWQRDALPATNDPHQIVQLVNLQAPATLPRIEAALTAAEMVAVKTAPETPGLGILLGKLENSGVPVAIASNNNAEAIRIWLHGRAYEIEHVVGRDPSDLSKMKPAPDTLVEAMALLRSEPSRTAFVGDAITDAKAAMSADCAFVAFANKPHKLEGFALLGCSIVVTDLNELAEAVAGAIADCQPTDSTT